MSTHLPDGPRLESKIDFIFRMAVLDGEIPAGMTEARAKEKMRSASSSRIKFALKIATETKKRHRQRAIAH